EDIPPVDLRHVRCGGGQPSFLPAVGRSGGSPRGVFCPPREYLMASMLSLFRRQQSAARKPKTSRPLLVELLEDRMVRSSLQLSVSPHALVEGTGPSSTATGTVTRLDTDNSQALTVNLVSSNTTEATVPAYVVIPGGQTSATFNITAPNDFIPDGTQNVT